MRSRLLPLLLVMTTTCIITNPTSYDLEPVSHAAAHPRPARADAARLGNLVSRCGDRHHRGVPKCRVDDSGVDDPLEWQLFVNVERECRSLDAACSPAQRGTVAPNGRRSGWSRTLASRRSRRVQPCRALVSSNFRFGDGNYWPQRDGDVDFATGGFKRAAGGRRGRGRPGESCAWRVTQ